MSENMGSINYSSEDRDVKKADLEGLSALESLGAEGLSAENPDSQGSAPEDLSSVEELKKRATAYVDAAKSSTEELKKKATAYVDAAKSSTEELKKKATAYVDAAKSTEDLKKSTMAYLAAVQPKTGEGQDKQPQEKTLSREIVERVLDQLDHFAPDDDYIVKLAEKHADGEDMTNIVGLREATRQRQLEMYKTVLSKALDNDAHARANMIQQLEQITDWLSGLDRDDFEEDVWKMIKDKAFELMDGIRTVAVTDINR